MVFTDVNHPRLVPIIFVVESPHQVICDILDKGALNFPRYPAILESLDCPTGSPLLMSSNQPWQCTPGSAMSVCPSPSACQYSQTRGQYICCIAGVAADVTPAANTNKTGTIANTTVAPPVATTNNNAQSEATTTPSAPSRLLKIDGKLLCCFVLTRGISS